MIVCLTCETMCKTNHTRASNFRKFLNKFLYLYVDEQYSINMTSTHILILDNNNNSLDSNKLARKLVQVSGSCVPTLRQNLFTIRFIIVWKICCLNVWS